MLPEDRSAPLDSGTSGRLRRAAGLLLAIAVALTAVMALSVHLLWQRELEARADQTRSMATAVLGYVERGFERADRALTLIAAQWAGARARPLQVDEPLSQLLARIQRLGMLFESIALIDATGNVIATSPVRESPPPADASLLAAHRDGRPDAMRITPPFRRDGEWFFGLSRPVRGAGGELLGVVHAVVSVHVTLDALEPLRPAHGGRNTVLTDRHVVLAHSPQGGIGDDLSRSPLAERVGRGEVADTYRFASPVDGVDAIASFVVSRPYGFIVESAVAVPAIGKAWIDGDAPHLTLIAVLALCIVAMMTRLFVTLRHGALVEQRLRASTEVALRDSIESMGEGFVLWDRNERLVLWNRRYPELLPHLKGLLRTGVHLDEIRKESARRAFPDLDDAAVDAWLEQRSARRRERGVPFDLHLGDGRTVQAVEHTTSEGGRVVIYRDITTERRALRDLSASEARFRDGIESIADGFILWDRDDRVAAWNRRCEILLPYAGQVLREGITFERYVHETVAINHADWPEPARRQRIAERLAQHRERNRTSEFGTRDGRTIEVRESPTSDGGCVSLFRDVTEARQLLARLTQSEAELQRALDAERMLNAQQRRFVSMASHEFRTPLAIIDGASQRILARGDAAGTDLHKRVDRIRGAVARMTEIIDRTLSTARLDDGHFEFTPAPCDLSALLQEICDRQRSIAPGRTIRLDLPAAPIVIDADAKLLDQVFTNLVSNAIKYSGPSAPVDIVATPREAEIEIAVQDRGLGIPADEIDRLFTRFFRASTTLSIPGTGIGLHLVKEFVTMHGGVVTLRSEVQKGSSFIVRLPRRGAADATVEQAVA